MRKFCFHLYSRKLDFHHGSSLDENNLIEPFLEACRRGNLDKVEAFLESGVDVNSVTEFGEEFALMVAVKLNNLELINILLDQGDIDVNMESRPSNITSLMMACHDDRPEIVKKLLKNKNIDLNRQDIYGNTAMMVAVLAGSVNCLRLLSTHCIGRLELFFSIKGNKFLSRKVKVYWNAGDNDRDDSAAILAVRVENIEIIKILVNIKDVNWNRKNEENESAFSLAVKSGNKEVVKLIQSYVSNLDVDVENLKNHNVYKAAAEGCRKFLSDKVKDITIRDGDDPDDSLIFDLKDGVSKLINGNSRDRFSSKKRFRLVYEDASQCPVCFEDFSKEVKVFQCTEGHFTCGKCRPKVNKCPECRSKLIGRAIGYERTLC